jgi:hypothetical protein
MAINLQDNQFQFHKHGGQVVTFEAHHQDTTDATYQYFGYVATSGAWLVQRFHIIGAVIIYQYAGGQKRADYDALWTAGTGVYAGSLTFTTIDQIGASL